MNRIPTSVEARAAGYRAPRRRTGSISPNVILAGLFGALFDSFLTYTLSKNGLLQDIGGLLSDRSNGFPPFVRQFFDGLGRFATVVFDSLHTAPIAAALAEFVARTCVYAVLFFCYFAAFKAVGWFVSLFLHPNAAASGPRAIGLPREPGGGARVGGWLVLGALAALIVVALVLPILVDSMSDGPTSWEGQSRSFLLGGLVSAAVFLLLDSRSVADETRSGDPLSDAPNSAKKTPDIAAFKKRLFDALPDRVLADLEIPPPAGTDTPVGGGHLTKASEAHARKLGRRIKPSTGAATWSDKDSGLWAHAIRQFQTENSPFVLLEPLTTLHYAFLVEAVSLTEDRGRGSLFIAPEASVDRLRYALMDAFSPHCRDITQVFWPKPERYDRDPAYIQPGGARPDRSKWNEQKSPQVIETIVIASDKQLQERILGGDANDFAAVIERLGLIVIVDAHLFDLAQLNLQIAILRQRVAAEPLKSIVQAAERQGLKDELDQIFRSNNLAGSELSLTGAAAAPVSCLVLSNDEAARDAILAAFFPNFTSRSTRNELDPLPVLALAGLSGPYAFVGNDIAVIDLDSSDAERRWKQPEMRLLGGLVSDAGRPPPATAGLFSRRFAQPSGDNPATLMLVQDRNNIVVALNSLSFAASGPRRLAVIASETYPLRDFMIEKLKGGRFQIGNLSHLMPMAPHPDIGPYELACLILARMSADELRGGFDKVARGITRREAIELFKNSPDRRRLEAQEYSPTRVGLKRLLKIQLEQEFLVYAKRPETPGGFGDRPGGRGAIDDDVLYTIDNVDSLQAAASGWVRLETSNKSAVGRVQRGDHGLAYLVGTNLMQADRPWTVMRVEATRVVVEPTNDPAGAVGAINSYPRTLFCRAYQIDADHATAVISRPRQLGLTKDHARSALFCFRLYAPLKRLTHATLTEGSLAKIPLAAVQPRDVALLNRAVCEFQQGLSLVLRFFVPTSDDSDHQHTASRLAFTLQTTLQDIVFSLFPALAHRVAVLSPQATTSFAGLASSQVPAEKHIWHRYPRFADVDVRARTMTEVTDTAMVSDRIEALFGAEFQKAATPAEAMTVIHVLIVEDWPGELGVCGAIAHRCGDILPMWLDYLKWLASATHDSPNDGFYRFGAPKLNDEFVFAAAAELLGRFT